MNAHPVSGLTNTFCSPELIRKLGIEGREETVNMATLGSDNNRWKARVASLQVYSKDGDSKVFIPCAYSRKTLAIDAGNAATAVETRD